MTITEDRLLKIQDSNQAIVDKLNTWGIPNVGMGARPRAAHQIRFDAEAQPSRTQQSFKDECDINRIMARHRKSGELTHLNKREPQYGDFTTGLDFQASQNAVMEAQADFDSLSAEIRARMGNNPATLLAFVNDPSNLDEARELGLIAPAPPRPEDPPSEGAAASEAPPPPPQPTPISGGE